MLPQSINAVPSGPTCIHFVLFQKNDLEITPSKSSSKSPVCSSTPIKANGHIVEEWEAESQSEQVVQLIAQLSKTRGQCNRDERRITELEEQLATVIQQNQALENQVVQLSHRGEEGMKSMHEELTTLEEVR